MADALADWLALREIADAAARSNDLVRAIADALPRGETIRVLDLATGTGSNIRYLASRLTRPQHWLAVDRDADLLRRIPRSLDVDGVACRIETRQLELGSLDDLDLFSSRHVVTASALLDLVSARWIESLASRCRDAGACVLFALSYDGRSACTPREPEDDEVRAWFNEHQRRSDKGFGPAEGPDAARCAIECFAAAGYRVRRERSDWMLLPDAAALQRQLIEGWAFAATEIAPPHADRIASWRARRLDHVDRGRSRILVGHEDFAAWLDRGRA
jgi:SAM-dependent methyltransferase